MRGFLREMSQPIDEEKLKNVFFDEEQLRKLEEAEALVRANGEDGERGGFIREGVGVGVDGDAMEVDGNV